MEEGAWLVGGGGKMKSESGSAPRLFQRVGFSFLHVSQMISKYVISSSRAFLNFALIGGGLVAVRYTFTKVQ